MAKLILASGSPRRRQLLAQVGLDFEVLVSDADETADGAPDEQVQLLARRKALATAGLLKSKLDEGGNADCAPFIIIAADTLVAVETAQGVCVLGKPADKHEAFEMLQILQGRGHTVYTGVALLQGGGEDAGGHLAAAARGDGGKITVFAEAAQVFFRSLSADEINAYIATGEPFDKAGAYGIQGKGALLVERVEGDFYTVMGLPVSRLCQELQKLGVDVFGSVPGASI
jgi:septum formation protein